MSVKFVLVAGARPNFMKIAPIMEAFRKRPEAEVLLVHTGQHYDQKMSRDFFTDLGIPEPDMNLGIGSGSHAQQTGRIMMAFEEVCLAQRPDWVIVVGDVNSTVACAITAKKLGIRVAHVEAGLRSRDMSMPEEVNRICTDAVADLLFTTDVLANDNLRREGVPDERIHFVGNTMIDTLLRHIGRARCLPLPDGLVTGGYAVLTLHRPSNVDREVVLWGILEAVREVAEQMPVIFPAHPRTAQNLRGSEIHCNIRVTEPLSYIPFLGLVANARLVLTDSGGIQEETTVLGIPCITVRPNTERPITCELGTNTLAGNDPLRIREAIRSVLRGGVRRASVPPQWDGHAAERIVQVLFNGSPSSG
jgi:UDP-N-acetylglucosamine 2-epimerase (non-hydrolysing)